MRAGVRAETSPLPECLQGFARPPGRVATSDREVLDIYHFDFSSQQEFAGVYIQALGVTLVLSVLSIFLATIVGVIAGLGRTSKRPVFAWPAAVYVEIIRDTPLLLQLLILYFGIGQIINLNNWTAAILGLTLFAGAYVAEIVRAGIESINKGQMEAALSLGLTYVQSMRFVILPQALRRILPPLAGQFISLIKDSSLASVLAISELTYTARKINTRTLRSLESYVIVGAIYFVLTFSLSRFVAYLERRSSASD